MIRKKNLAWVLINLVIFTATSVLTFAADELVPEDECVVELTLPEDSTVKLQGRDYGTRRMITYDSLTPGKINKVPLEIHYPSGKTSEHTLLLKGGRRVRLAKCDPAKNNLELVEMAGLPPITGLCCSKDWKYLIGSHRNGTISIWDLKRKRLLRYFHNYALASRYDDVDGICATLSPDDSKLLVPLRNIKLKEGPVAIYEVFSGKWLLTLITRHSGLVNTVSYSPDGKTVLTGSLDETAILRDIATDRRLRTFKGHANSVESVAFSPNGKKVLTGSWDETAILWDVATGRRLRTFEGHAHCVEAVAFSPDGKRVLTGSSDDMAILWDVASGQRLRTFIGGGHSDVFPSSEPARVKIGGSVAFSPDGEKAFTGSLDGTASLWDIPTGRRLRTFEGDPDGVCSATFSPNGKRLFLGGDRASIWDIESGKEQWSFNRKFYDNWDVCLSPDKKLLAVAGDGDDRPGVFSLETGKRILELRPKDGCELDFAFGPSGKILLVGECEPNYHGPDNGSAILWDIDSGRKLRTFNAHVVDSGAISPDSRTMLIEFMGEAIIYDITTGRRLLKLEGDKSSGRPVTFCPNGTTVVTGTWEDTAILWDVQTGRKLRTFKGHAGRVESVAFSPDGKTILTGFSDGKGILWDFATGRRLHTLKGHTGWFRSSDFSLDGKTVLTASEDGTIILWDVATGKILRRLRAPSQDFISHVSFDRAGNHILATGVWRLLYVWDVATGELVACGSRTEDGILFTTPEGLFDGPAKSRNNVCYRVGKGLNVLPVDQFSNGFYYPGLLPAILRGERPLPSVKVEAPPTIRIVSPASGHATEKEQATIEAVIEDQGGGIEEPVAKLNGCQYDVKLSPVRENGNRLRWRFSIPLISGVENKIEVHSAAANGAIASEPGMVVIKCEKPKERPELYMVAVGISDYENGKRFGFNLRCARNDAESLARVFRERGESFYGKGRVHVFTVLDAEATKDGIEAAMAKVAKMAKPQDVFILLLSGHGKTIGKKYYFIPYEYKAGGEGLVDEQVRRQALPHDELNDWIAGVRATKRVLIYDTCESGAALTRNAFGYQHALESLARSSGCHIIAATISKEEAQEMLDLGHGALTYALLGGLGAAEKGPLENRHVASLDGLVHALDWFRFARKNVPKLTKDSIGKKQYITFSPGREDFPILPVKTKEKN